MTTTKQSGNTVGEGDLIGRDKTEIHNYQKTTKLSHLFDRLREEFDQQIIIHQHSDDLKRYSEPRDTIGLEQKLHDGNLDHQVDDAKWLKQQYFKKLTKFQFYEPAQEIHAYLLSIVLERFRNTVSPLIRVKASEIEITKAISDNVINPIMTIIREDGGSDIMGLSSTDLEGMIYFLTGQCHIKWI